MKRALAAAALILASMAGAAGAQAGGKDTVRELVVYGNDPCPRSSDEEVVVCARRPESERYRIPPSLRETPPSPDSESWASKAESLEMVGRTGIGSCSPVGPGGVTGCLEQFIRQAREERRANGSTQSKIP